MSNSKNSELHASLSKSLVQLEGLLNKTTNNLQMLDAQLHSNMLPLAIQVKVCCNFICRIASKITQTDTQFFESERDNFEGLMAQIKATRLFLAQTPFDDELWQHGQHFADDIAGEADILLPISQYILQFALPNYYFHLSMVYAILRKENVPVGKGDFDGIHQYPAGFSFVAQSD